MLRGRFGDTTGAPYIEGFLVLPNQKIRTQLSLLVDTGATQTVIMPTDSLRAEVDFNTLLGAVESHGIGGITNDYREPGYLLFAEPGVGLQGYRLDFIVARPTDDNRTLPSLLGRDVIDRWRMVYDKPGDGITFDVLTADETIPEET